MAGFVYKFIITPAGLIADAGFISAGIIFNSAYGPV